MLLGVHDRRAQWDSSGKVVELRTNSPTEEAKFPAHLGFYIKAAEVRKLEQTIRKSLEPDKRNLNWECHQDSA
jgi:hypothetical protein